jgi:enoyl-CoA hydratase
VADGDALPASVRLAEQLSALPQAALRGDRLSMLEQWELSDRDAVANEVRHGLHALTEGVAGAARFSAGAGRHGKET